ncbi:MAG: ribosome maturation factor RimP [Butyricicoccaceae bacterium]
MTGKEVCQRVRELSAPTAEQIGVSIWDVTFEKEGGQYMLTVTIDREQEDRPVDLDDCETLSRAIDPMLDGKEFASLPPYTLCVSSAGIARTLRLPEHFAKYIGAEVEVRFYRAINGAKFTEGTLVDYEDGNVTIDADGSRVIYEAKDVALVRLSVHI